MTTQNNREDPNPVTYAEPGTYTITVNAVSGCGPSSASTTFTLFAPPDIPTIDVSSPVCVGADITARLIGNPDIDGLTFSWTGPNGFVSMQAEWTIMDATTAMSGNYILTVTDANGCFEMETYPVSVTTTAPFSIDPNPGETCVDVPITLRANGAGALTWEGPNLSSTTGSEVIFQSSEAGIFEIIAFSTDPDQECPGRDTTIITVHPRPVVSAGDPDTVCQNTDLQLVGSPASGTGNNDFWTGPNVSSTGLFNAADPGTYTVTYHFEDMNGCEDSSMVDICVVTVPVPAFTLVDSVCVSAASSIAVENMSTPTDDCRNPSYTWSINFIEAECDPSSTGNAGFASGNASSFEPLLRFSEAGIYEVSLTVQNRCGPQTTTQRIVVGDEPTVEITAVDDACGSLDVTPTFTSQDCNASITSWEWTFTDGTVNTHSGPTPPTITFGPGNHTIRLTVMSDCGMMSDEETFRVFEGPDLTDIELSNDSVCAGQSLMVTGVAGGTELEYTWSVLDDASNTIGFSSTTIANPTITFNGTPHGLYTIRLSAQSMACTEPIIREFQVFVNEAPQITQLLAPENDCGGITFTPQFMTNLPEERLTEFQWTVTDQGGMVEFTTNTYNPGEITLSEPDTYTLTFRIANECDNDERSVTFRVFDGPRPLYTITEDTLCRGAGAIVTMMDQSMGDITQWSWTVTGPNGPEPSFNMNTQAPMFSFVDPMLPLGEYTILLSAGNGVCTDVTWDTTIFLTTVPDLTITPIVPDACNTYTFTPMADFGDFEDFGDLSDFIDSTDVVWTFPTGSTPESYVGFNPGPVTINAPGLGLEVVLEVSNRCGPDREVATFDLLLGPTASFTVDETEVCATATVNVTDMSDGNNLEYSWSAVPATGVTFSSTTVAQPEITFSGPPGDYTIRVDVGNELCNRVPWDTVISVNVAPTVAVAPIGNNCEMANFTPDVTITPAPEFIDSVRWTVTNDDTGEVVFTAGPDPSGNVEFGGIGDFTFTATVYNRCAVAGISSSQSFNLLEGIDTDVTVNDTLFCPGEVIDFTNSSSGTIDNYAWSIIGPDGMEYFSSPEASPNFTFATTSTYPVGQYTATLIMSNAECDSVTFDTTLAYLTPPNVIIAEIMDSCSRIRVDPSVEYGIDEDFIEAITWQISRQSDGAVVFSSATDNFPVVITTPDTYTLTVTASNHCADMGVSATEDFQVFASPVPRFTVDRDTVCRNSDPNTVTVSNNGTSGDISSYLWEVFRPDGSEITEFERTNTDSSPVTFTFDDPSFTLGNYRIRVTAANT
ncbi:MAG: PKD domain-containing protein, partial [Bacteroidota bacterium]